MRNPASAPAERAERHARGVLLGVCMAFALLPTLLMPLSLPLGWDEIVYAGRFSAYAHGLEIPFEAPRTRGVPALIAPVASWSDSVVLLRGWLSLLAGAALYAGFLPWLRVFRARPHIVPVAAAGYGSLWFALFYVASAMPNHYTAMGATAAVGCALRYAGGEGKGERGRVRRLWCGRAMRLLCGVALGLGVVTLMRPNDAVWIAGSLVAALFLHRPWRAAALRLASAAAVGVVVAAVPWAVESELRFGGVRERLALATEQQGGMELQFNLPAVINALDGPLLCRPCGPPGITVPGALASLWWYALPLLVGSALWLARRRDRQRTRSEPGGSAATDTPLAALVLPTVVAGAAALTYVFLIDYAAPRFLLTSYALLALPAAVALRALWAAARRRGRLACVALFLVAAGHVAVQLAVVHHNAGIQSDARRDWARVTAALRDAGIRRGCVLDGNSMVIPIAYTAGCFPTAQRPGEPPDALVLRNGAPPRGGDWRVIRVPGTYNKGWRIGVPVGLPR